MTVTSGSIVDAAHIHRFADSRNNDPRNGVALCKNAHWLFDLGLWTLGDDYRVRVATTKFSESGADALLLKPWKAGQFSSPLILASGLTRSTWPGIGRIGFKGFSHYS